MTIQLPRSICFRVTRYCNARCGFCLAPPDGAHPDADTLIHRVDWLLDRGVTTIHFCGGEPTIHPALRQLISHTHGRGGKTKLTTNGITISDEVVAALRSAGARVKFSLHGDREHHDRIVGRQAFDRATSNLRRLAAAGIHTAVQTTVVAGHVWVVDWVAEFCLRNNLSQLSILPFIPRGSGNNRRGEYELSAVQRREVRVHVARKRRALSGKLDIRWLDFTAQPVHVVEANGWVVLEHATEAMDVRVCRIPEGADQLHGSGAEGPYQPMGL
jgi:MoaA/NifB/PqqE/SkfB family radical SAM enzyme